MDPKIVGEKDVLLVKILRPCFVKCEHTIHKVIKINTELGGESACYVVTYNLWQTKCVKTIEPR